MVRRPRPKTLVEGQEYLLRERVPGGAQVHWRMVVFAAYDPCPGMVILRSRQGRIRSLREDLFSLG